MMIRMLRSLAVFVLALSALGAHWAGSAVAAAFHSGAQNYLATVEQDATEGSQKIVAGGSSITCTEARFEATNTTTTATNLTLKPLKTTSASGAGYSGCTFFGVPTIVFMGTCDLVLNATGLIDVAGCSGVEPYISYEATVFGASCEIRIGNQSSLSKATYTNIGSGTTAEVTIDVAVTGIKYDAIGSLCNPAGLGQNNGTYSGKLTATGEVDGTTTHTGFSFS
jgi:hypothetical protein